MPSHEPTHGSVRGDGMNAVGLSAAGAAGGAGALAGPIPQRRVRAAIDHRLVRRERGFPRLLLFARQPKPRERAEADAALDLGHGADRLEGLCRLREALLLELRLAHRQPRLRPHRVVVALGRLRGERGGGLPVLLLEGGRREIERHLAGQRILGEVRRQTLPRRLTIAGTLEPRRDLARGVERVRRRRVLLHQRLVGVELVRLVGGARQRQGNELARGGRLRVVRVGGEKRAQLGDAAARIGAGGALDPAAPELGVGDERRGRILPGNLGEQRQRLGRPLEIGQGARGLQRRRRRQHVIGKRGEQLVEARDRGFGMLELEVAPRTAIERLGRQRAGGIGAHHRVVGVARVEEALETEQRLRLPEARLLRPARRRGQHLRALERVERGLRVARLQPRLAEQQDGLRQPRVLGILRDEPFERAARGGIQAVRERALADERRAVASAWLEPGAREALDGARAAGFSTVLWTNNAREVTQVALDRFALADALDLVVTRDDMAEMKPSADGWRVIAARFAGVRDAIVVGDSWVDGLAAATAGIPFVAYRPREAELTRWKITPIARIDDLAALPTWLRAWAGQ